ncbi:hypothetical protein VQ7734_01242 [Vibrio quintilis]|uniref:Uncharacterized protein n=1 Tax=Vibrio quintilis TaxID=1117707 RepID=A0A1M7YSK0_9VIBR|nr:hypothetical protein VQ7734_01242 [Vibrio quintilis]
MFDVSGKQIFRKKNQGMFIVDFGDIYINYTQTTCIIRLLGYILYIGVVGGCMILLIS